MSYPKSTGLTIAAALLATTGNFSPRDVLSPSNPEPEPESDSLEIIQNAKCRAISKRFNRGTARLVAYLDGGFPSLKPRHPILAEARRTDEESSVETRQQIRAQARRKSIATANLAHGIWTRQERRLIALHSFRVNCRKNGPRGGRDAKQLSIRRLVIQAFGLDIG